MGWFSNWRTKRRENRVRREIKSANGTIKKYFGKDMAELAREGGWDLVAGNDWSWLQNNWTSANDLWKKYSMHDLEITYTIASSIHACIRLKATTASQAWMELGQYKKNGWKAIDDHPFYQLIRRPNGGQDRTSFVWEFVAHAETTGYSYVWKVRNKGREIIAMQPLPTSWIRKEYSDSNNQFIGYTLRNATAQNGQSIFIAPEDMFVMRYPSASDPTTAAGPLQAALKDLQVDDSRSDLLVEMLTNIHFPGAIFKSEMGWTKQDKEEARAVLRDLIGPGRRASPLFVNGVKSEVELPSPPKDMDWPGTAAQAEARICAAFGVPPIMVHFRSGLENGTYSNYEQARKAFYQDTMRSLWEMMASAYERGLFIEEGEPEIEIKPNWDDVPEMQEDESERHQRIRDDYHGGLLMWDEAIESVGGKPLPGNMGKVYLRPVNLEVVSITNEAGGTVVAEEVPEDLEEDDEHLEDADVEEIDEEDEIEADEDTEEATGKSVIIVTS